MVEPFPGGWSLPTRVSNVQDYIDMLKDQVEAKFNAKFSVYEAFVYIQQIVEGSNYVVSINTGNGDLNFLHVQLHAPLTGDPRLIAATDKNKRNTPLKPLVQTN